MSVAALGPVPIVRGRGRPSHCSPETYVVTWARNVQSAKAYTFQSTLCTNRACVRNFNLLVHAEFVRDDLPQTPLRRLLAYKVSRAPPMI
jgi:hypothetical protein